MGIALMALGATEFLAFVASIISDKKDDQSAWYAFGLIIGVAMGVLVFVRFA